MIKHERADKNKHHSNPEQASKRDQTLQKIASERYIKGNYLDLAEDGQASLVDDRQADHDSDSGDSSELEAIAVHQDGTMVANNLNLQR